MGTWTIDVFFFKFLVFSLVELILSVYLTGIWCTLLLLVPLDSENHHLFPEMTIRQIDCFLSSLIMLWRPLSHPRMHHGSLVQCKTVSLIPLLYVYSEFKGQLTSVISWINLSTTKQYLCVHREYVLWISSAYHRTWQMVSLQYMAKYIFKKYFDTV